MSRSFYTKYPFRCAGCGDNHPADTSAHYQDKYLVADDCREGADEGLQMPENGRVPAHRMRDTMPHGKTAKDRCDVCFIVHASGQTECY